MNPTRHFCLGAARVRRALRPRERAARGGDGALFVGPALPGAGGPAGLEPLAGEVRATP